jgi:hypothetical protein
MNLHRRLSGRWRLVLASAAVAAVAIGTAGPVGAATATPAPAFAAVDLADAVLFDLGPAAPFLDGVDRSHNAWTELGRRYRTVLIDAIRADARWGRSFAARLQSGDRATIDQALHDLGVLAHAQADQVYGVDTVDRAIGMGHVGEVVYVITPPFEDDSLDIVLENTSAVVMVYIVASWLTTDPGDPANLLRDQLVHEIATHLATSR